MNEEEYRYKRIVTEACGLGAAFHAALRKAPNCPQATAIHMLIEEMDDASWNAILASVYDSMPDGVQTAMEAEGVAFAARHR